MGTQLEHYGNSNQESFGSSISISARRAWVHDLNATTTSLVVQLPDARKCNLGYPVIQIVVNPSSNDFEIQDASGSTLVAVASANDVYTFALFDNSTLAGDWEYGLWTLGSASAPSQTIFPWTLGGTIGGSNEAWEFDFTADSWTQGSTNAGTTYTDPVGARIQGNGHIGNDTKDHESYDPQVWTVETDHSVDRRGAAGAELSTSDDRAYFFGGRNNTTGDEAEYWDDGDSSFTAIGDIPTRRMLFTASGDGTDFYLLGGGVTVLANISGTDKTTKYDTSLDSYSDLSAFSQDILYHTTSEDHNGDLITYCGADQTSSGPTFYDDVDRYDLIGDSHSALTAHPNGTGYQLGSSHIDENQRNYVFGGANSTNPDASYEHVTSTDSYNAKTDHAGTTIVRGVMESTLSLTS